MPKTKESTAGFFARMNAEFPGVFRNDNSVLFCTYCDCQVTGSKIFNVKQHITSVKHQKTAKLRQNAGKNTQTLLTEYQQQKINPFNMELCKSFVEANIPLKKVSHPSIVKFMEKYTSKTMPSESSLRQKYVPLIYEECLADLRAKAKDRYIWVSIDETTDAKNRMVANFVFGFMDLDESHPEHGKCYLLDMAVIST